MWQSYLRIAARALAKNRLFSALNILGLAVGMAACTLIALWVSSETSHDHWVPEAERVFMVQSQVQYPGKNGEQWRHSPAPMLPLLLQDFGAQIEAGSRVMTTPRTVHRGAQVESQTVLLVDAGFFDVLPWPVLEGSTATALKQPGKLVVTQTLARKWFGNTSAVGQVMTFTVKGAKRPYEIVAVLRDPPTNSTFEFEAVALIDLNDFPDARPMTSWGSFFPLSVVRLRQASDTAVLASGAEAFVSRHAADFLKVESGFYYRPALRNIRDVHLQNVTVAGPGRPLGNPQLVAAVAATGLLVLVIATITYVNLVTARVSLRSREVGLRKTLGATRGQLMRQFLVESTLLAALAAVLALAIVELSLPAFNALLGQRLSLHYLGSGGALAPLAAMVLFVGLIGGWYPALVLARLRPREALAGQRAEGGAWIRQGLVIGQFAIAVTLMCCMAVIYAQVMHLRNVDMGYQPEGLIVVGPLTRAEVRPRQQALLDAVLRVPGVVSASRSMFDPTGGGIARQPAYLPGVPDAQAPQLSTHPVDWNYLKTYGARLLAGRDLSRDIAGDDTNALSDAEIQQRGVNVLINRAAVPLFGTTDAQAVVGKTFGLGGEPGRYTATVVGVIDDLRIRSARDEPLPSFYARDGDEVTTLSVRFGGVAPAEMMQRLEGAWKQLFPETPFGAKLVDDAIAAYYVAEMRSGNLFALFASLAIALCAVGLYGLAVFTAERRTREIGLRKLMGASVLDIVRLLGWQFCKPVLLALLIAWPLAWWLMRQWLNGFDQRIALSPWPFLAAGALALAIALATVAAHALKVARGSPIEALRHE
jgi:putative ABC transport system permease protein